MTHPPHGASSAATLSVGSDDMRQETYYDIRRKGAPNLRVARDLKTGGLWISDHTMGVWFHAEDMPRIIGAILRLYPELHREMVAADEVATSAATQDGEERE